MVVGRISIIITLCLSVIYFAATGHAQASISHSYTSDNAAVLAPGSLVSAEADGTTITLADTTNAARLLGVVVPLSQSVLAIDATSTKTQVAISGTATAFVSTIAGNIKAGDEITASPIQGVGMKAGANMRAVGMAQSDFSSDSLNATTRTITNRSGQSSQVAVGTIPITVLVGDTSPSNSNSASGLVSQVNGVATIVSGHSVSPVQSIMGLVVALIAAITLITLIYGAIKGSLISIGRNPLSRSSIYSSLVQVVIMSLMIVIVAIAIIYLILL